MGHHWFYYFLQYFLLDLKLHQGAELNQFLILFAGSGHAKLKTLLKSNNALFLNTVYSAQNMVTLAEHHFKLKSFASLAYSEPFYGKEFFNSALSKK